MGKPTRTPIKTLGFKLGFQTRSGVAHAAALRLADYESHVDHRNREAFKVGLGEPGCMGPGVKVVASSPTAADHCPPSR